MEKQENRMGIEVIRSRRKTLCAEIRQGRLIVRAPLRSSDQEIRRFLEEKQQWIQEHLAKSQAREEAKKLIPVLTEEEIRFLMQQARLLLPQRVSYYARLLGVTYGRITVRCQRTRWGSCSSSGNLNFNCLLMLAPRDVVDSVIVHELCHRKHMNHSDAFYAEVLRVFPDYRAQNGWLKKNGPLLMARLGNPSSSSPAETDPV